MIKQNKTISAPVGILIIVTVAILTGGILIWQYQRFVKPADIGQNACTQEAKLCPDGSSVGRTGPNCEFAPCPGETDIPKFIEPGGDGAKHLPNSFYSCADAGYPVLQSFPEKCMLPDGTTFVNWQQQGVFCVQVIQPARNPKTGEVREFPTPCDVPDGWVQE
jgi:hypothetical protein